MAVQAAISDIIRCARIEGFLVRCAGIDGFLMPNDSNSYAQLCTDTRIGGWLKPTHTENKTRRRGR